MPTYLEAKALLDETKNQLRNTAAYWDYVKLYKEERGLAEAPRGLDFPKPSDLVEFKKLEDIYKRWQSPETPAFLREKDVFDNWNPNDPEADVRGARGNPNADWVGKFTEIYSRFVAANFGADNPDVIRLNIDGPLSQKFENMANAIIADPARAADGGLNGGDGGVGDGGPRDGGGDGDGPRDGGGDGGPVDVNRRGGVDVNRGGVDVNRGGIDVNRGGVDVNRGGIDVNRGGGVDVNRGGGPDVGRGR